jgi:hypothetical protein
VKIADYKGHTIWLPTSGGKAGKGHAQTTALQARRNGFIVARARFTVSDENGMVKPIRKLRATIDRQEFEAVCESEHALRQSPTAC